MSERCRVDSDSMLRFRATHDRDCVTGPITSSPEYHVAVIRQTWICTAEYRVEPPFISAVLYRGWDALELADGR